MNPKFPSLVQSTMVVTSFQSNTISLGASSSEVMNFMIPMNLNR